MRKQYLQSRPAPRICPTTRVNAVLPTISAEPRYPSRVERSSPSNRLLIMSTA